LKMNDKRERKQNKTNDGEGRSLKAPGEKH